MPLRFAISSSGWSTGSTWDGFVTLGFPTAADDVYSNSYTVNVDTNIRVNSLNNGTTPQVVEAIATPAMTSNATPSGFVYASSFQAGFEGWRVFDQNTSTFWQSTTANAANITYEFPTARNIKRYAIRAIATGNAGVVPRNWRFQGSNDNINFTTLETVSSSLAQGGVYTSAVLANTASFTFYRVDISSVAVAGNSPAFAELELTESTGSGVGNLSGGTFNFNTPNVSASVGAASITAGALNLMTISAATGTVNISAPNAALAGAAISGTPMITHNGNCDFIITASSFSPGNSFSTICINKTSTGTITMVGNLLLNNQSDVCTLNSNAGNTVIIGSLVGGTTTGGNVAGNAVRQTAGSLTIRGNVTAGAGNNAITNYGINFSGTTLTITGSITGGTGTNAAAAINITSTPTVNISGSIVGSSGIGLQASTAATFNITGSVIGGAAAGISLTGASTLTVNGTVTGGSGAVGISSTSTSATNRLTGPFITGPTGIQPFYGPKLTIITGSATYWTFTAPNLTTNKTLYSTDLVSGVPSPANVRQGVTYASGALTGTMIVPPTSSVAFGVPVGSSTGSAIIVGSNYDLSGQVWNTPVTSLTGSSTIGARLRNNATVASTGAQIAAMAGL